jgi:cytochrome c oxidase subunit 2
MRHSRTVFAVIVAALFCASLIFAQEPRQITVIAKKYEFEPSRIELKAGEPVEITFQSEDTKHGFVCKDLNLEKVVFAKDSPGKVTFTPDKAGTYKFKCAKFCGLGHGKMKGEIVVAP